MLTTVKAERAFESREDTPFRTPALEPARGPVQDAGADLPVLLRYWRMALRWKYVIGGVILGSLVLGIIVTLLMTPQYTSTASIEISRQQDRVVQVQDVRPESSNVDLEFYQTQYALLRARSLAERVALDLKLVEDDRFFDMFGVDLNTDGLFAAPRGDRLSPAERSERRKKAIDTLLDNVEINPIRGSRLVEVGFSSPDPAFSSRVADSWVKHFIDANLERRFDATSYARAFLEGRLETLRRRLEESERLLVAYAGRQRIINVPSSAAAGGPERPIVAEDLASINEALAQATADRIQAGSRLAAGGGGANAEALQNTAISALRQRRGEAAAEYAKLQAQFEPGYPPAQALANQVRELDRAIAREEGRVQQSLANAYRQAQNRESTLRARVEGLKGDLLDLRNRSIQFNIYQRDVDTNRQLYDGLLQRYKEIGVAGGVGTNNIAVVDRAQPSDEPSSPNLPLNLALALLAGILVSAGAVVALEQIDEAIKDPKEAQVATGLPLLGAIPLIEGATAVEALDDRKSAASEAYLSVQTNLQFSTDHGVPRSLAVVSTRPSEGKSTTSYSLALSQARTGRKVALIDGDIRSPSLHHLANVANNRGTSNFLAGDDDLENLLTSLPSIKVALMTAGASPPNAAELLTSPRLALLIRRLLESYDHVVIDSPPVVGLADAPLIASRVEGVVYTVEAGGARSSVIRTALQRLHSANANVLGVVLTKFQAKRAHYGYGYDYGYGYGSTEKRASLG